MMILSNNEERSWCAKVIPPERSSKIIEAGGWYLSGTVGDHYQFKHPTKKGRVTVPHPKKDLKSYEIASIRRQSGLNF